MKLTIFGKIGLGLVLLDMAFGINMIFEPKLTNFMPYMTLPIILAQVMLWLDLEARKDSR